MTSDRVGVVNSSAAAVGVADSALAEIAVTDGGLAEAAGSKLSEAAGEEGQDLTQHDTPTRSPAENMNHRTAESEGVAM